jgi:UDPglucose--hexose-1-phosphate uridylyltransferase
MASNHPAELRQDGLTNTWVACAPRRSGRPVQTGPDAVAHDPTDDTPVEGCPFCPGHEDELPAILWEHAADDDRPWTTRVVPNKYPALDASPPTEREADSGLYRRRDSTGRQEVIIDTPYHYQGLAQMSVAQVEAVLRTYRERYDALRSSAPDLYPFVFRNHGRRAGASLPHPHSQIIATEVRPPRIEREEAAAQARYDDTGRCPYCEMIATELRAEVRMVWQDEHAVMFVPYAAKVPCALWILPRRHDPEFGHMTAPQRASVAAALQQASQRYYTRLDDPAFNLYVRTALDRAPDAPHLHWSLRLQPRTSRRAGFEQSTGMHVNPSIPERDAALLRDDSPSGD